MSISLTSLPPELLSCIAANIASWHPLRKPRPTLCNLARCSRQLHLCTIPHLYRHVDVLEILRRGEQQDGRLRTLASLLIRRPDLAGHVRHFTLRVLGPEHEESFNLPAGPEHLASPELVKVGRVFATPANASSLSKEEKINSLGQFSPTHRSHYDLILALLLPALLKVEKLVLHVDIECDTYYFEQMIRRAACRETPFDIRPPFEALKVFVHSDEGYDALSPRSTGFLASLLKLPAIQKISGGFEMPSFVEEENSGQVVPSHEGLADLDSSSSPVTSLDLAVYALSTADLGHILRAPKSLKTLVYRVCPPACINFTDVRRALASQENSLECLTLDCDAVCDMENEIVGSMTSFISFNTLKSFQTAALFLATMKTHHGSERLRLFDMFPRSLEKLSLTRFHACFKGLLIALEHLLHFPKRTPSLKTLVIDESYSFDPTDDMPISQTFGARPVQLRDLLWEDTQETILGRLHRLVAIRGVYMCAMVEFRDEDRRMGPR